MEGSSLSRAARNFCPRVNPSAISVFIKEAGCKGRDSLKCIGAKMSEKLDAKEAETGVAQSKISIILC